MRISARTRYGLRILLDIATGDAEEGGKPRSIHTIAKSQGISAAFISRLAVPLRKAGLIRTVRGTDGGLLMGRPPESITFLDIVEAVDGPVAILKCLANPKRCKRTPSCPVRALWDGLNDKIRSDIASLTLSDVIESLSSTPPAPCAAP